MNKRKEAKEKQRTFLLKIYSKCNLVLPGTLAAAFARSCPMENIMAKGQALRVSSFLK